MNNPPSRKPNIFSSISNIVRDLFIGERDSAYLYWILGGITLIGMIIRLLRIHEPIDYDEAYTFIHYATRPLQQILSDYSAPNNHILHTILVSIFYRLLGGHLWIVRVPAFIAGTLCIPAAYFASRKIFNSHQSLAAAALIALTPWFISYSANGRGYTLIMLFTLLLMNFAGILVRQQTRAVLVAYGITAALGLYTIPIFLFPLAGISLWVLFTYLTDRESRETKLPIISRFIITCVLAGLFAFLLYSPIIFFGTGATSIISNEFVESRDGGAFIDNLGPRAVKTWQNWMQGITPPIRYLLLSGFLISLLFYRKASKQRLPLLVFLVLAILILIIVQQIAPLARVWIYLEVFYMLFAGAGLAWLAEILLNGIGFSKAKEKIIPTIILLTVISVFISIYQKFVSTDIDDSPEQFAAEYLAAHITAQDTILSIAPVDIRTAYYLYLDGIPYDVFFQRDHPVQIQNAFIVLRKNSKYNSPESVVDYYQLTSNFDLQSVHLVFEYGPLNIFSVSAK